MMTYTARLNAKIALLGGVIEHIKEPENELLFRHNIAGDLAVRNTNNFNTHEFLDIANAIIRVNAVYSGNFGKVVKGSHILIAS